MKLRRKNLDDGSMELAEFLAQSLIKRAKALDSVSTDQPVVVILHDDMNDKSLRVAKAYCKSLVDIAKRMIVADLQLDPKRFTLECDVEQNRPLSPYSLTVHMVERN